MTLLLGPPGSGKTTLLLALAGRLDKVLKVRRKKYFYIITSFAIIKDA
jgi:ABC-type multidrug transport system ATPase subunit